MATVLKKRKQFSADELTITEQEYFLSGHDMFNELDTERMPEKWRVHREEILKQWDEPGKRPWGWWNLDHPEYRRKLLTGTPGYGECNNGIPRYYSGACTYESEAAFLKRKGEEEKGMRFETTEKIL